ncbi:MAG: efflux RND transporter periplasmic adaptor subunit [Litoreibacter sp.]|nr:efflux RND transporter periplasmic adaptor subunit [Litoreibacter sp.]
MRIVPVFIAAIVATALYLLVFERDRLLDFAAGDASPETTEETPVAAVEEPENETEERVVSVVAVKSEAREIDSTVLLRGRTEAARQIDVRAETSGLVISEPLRKGAYVEAGQLMCAIDQGTRETALAEAEARVPEAAARIPEAEGRLAEAASRLEEARINDNAAEQLSKDGFASTTRVASARAALTAAEAAVESAKAGVQAAEAGVKSAQAAVASAKKEIERLNVLAPFSGLLETDTAELGALLQPGSSCATIIQLDPIKLVGFVPENDVSKIEVGAQAGARLISGREVIGEVTFVSRSSDMETRTFRVELSVPNADLSIRDGQTAEILIASEGTMAHLLPASALTLNDEGELGVRLARDNKAAFAPVRILRDTVDGVWLDGLPAAADVIVVGQEYVIDGVAIDITYREAAG